MPSFDASSKNAADATTSLSASHTCSGSDRLLLCAPCNRSPTASAITAITYNLISLSAVSGGDAQNSPDARVRLYTLTAPATGANTLSITFGTSCDACFVAASYTAVDQTTPLGTANAAPGGPSDSPTVTITSATGELVVGATSAGVLTTITAGADQTQRAEELSATNDAELSDEAGGASVVHSYTYDTSRNWAIAGVPLKPAAGGGAAVPLRLIPEDQVIGTPYALGTLV